MDLIINQFRAVYNEHPVLVVGLIVASLIVGVYLGFRLVGPAILG